MCVKILEAQGKMSHIEYSFFLKGGVILDRATQPDNPCGEYFITKLLPCIQHFKLTLENINHCVCFFFFNFLVWLDPVCWDNVTELDKLPGFHGLVSSFEQFTRDWHSWYTLQDPENNALIGKTINYCISIFF